MLKRVDRIQIAVPDSAAADWSGDAKCARRAAMQRPLKR